MIKWHKIKWSPIPEYYSNDGKWRIFKSKRFWILQEVGDNMQPKFCADSFGEAKLEAERLTTKEIGNKR